MATTLPHLQNDLLKALAVGGAQRAAALPKVPTVAETIPGFESSSWQGLFVPAHRPARDRHDHPAPDRQGAQGA